MITDGFLAPGLTFLGNATRPRCLELGGELVMGAIDSTIGTLYIYEGGTLHSIGSTPIADDHNAPAILAPTDKPPIVAWTRHGQDASVRLKVGTIAADLTSLGAEQTLNAGSAASYTAFFRRPGTDTLLLLTRNTLETWRFFRSTNWASSWTGPTTLLNFGTGSQGYVFAGQSGDVLQCVAFEHWSVGTGDHKAYFFTIDLSDGSIDLRDGTNLANLDGTGLPLTPADLEVAYTPAAGDNMRVLDVANDATPTFLLMRWDDALENDLEYRHIRWNGATWADTTIAPAGTTITGNINHAAGGCIFAPDNADTIYTSREVSGLWIIERRDTADSGATWPITRALSHSRTVPIHKLNAVANRVLVLDEIVWNRVAVFKNYNDLNASLAGERRRI